MLKKLYALPLAHLPMGIYLYVDGASRGNPGIAGIGLVVRDCKGNTLTRYRECIGIATNNVAEYRALKKGLEIAARYGRDITVMSDSILMVRQMSKEYKVRRRHLRELVKQVGDLIARENLDVKYEHIPRWENADADRLANEAIDMYLAGDALR